MYEYNYLMHWGIKGMKWGLRRYQNPDGTLTEAGKIRYERQQAQAADRERRKTEQYKAKAAKKENEERYGGGKKISEMTDDELNAYIKRLQLEQNYKKLMDAQHPSSRQRAADLVREMSKKLITGLADKGVEALLNRINTKPEDKSKKKTPQEEELERLKTEKSIISERRQIKRMIEDDTKEAKAEAEARKFDKAYAKYRKQTDSKWLWSEEKKRREKKDSEQRERERREQQRKAIKEYKERRAYNRGDFVVHGLCHYVIQRRRDTMENSDPQ